MKPRIQPPGETERIVAGSVLVLAPHYDDEVLGCGGLLLELASQGAAVRVLFLTDSGGGEQAPEDREAYSSRRREEAQQAADVLGLVGLHHLGLPDGQLSRHLEGVAEGIRRALLTARPELLLVPSPLEVSEDHRAAFAALHQVLSPVRGDSELDAVAADLGILVYEVNQPAYPDLLVDVSPHVAAVEQAMRCYASQLEHHDYLAGALGLRRYRTLTLPKEVAAAEGYRRLTPSDFVTRSLRGLVGELGGVTEPLEVREGPRISVIVRTRDRPELLQEALESVERGVYRRLEVVLVNDGGSTPNVRKDFSLPLVRVELPENRGRAAAAQAGLEAASGDFVAFLDDDDLYEPEHLATLADLVSAAEVRVAYTDAAVGVYELQQDGWRLQERRLPYSRDFDPEMLLFDNYIPFHTLLMDRRLVAEVGAFDLDLPIFEDWDYLIRVAALVPFHHLRQVTCEYRHFRGGQHHALGDTPRERSDFLEIKERVVAKHAGRHSPELLARVVDRLRAEMVEQAEAAQGLRRESRQRLRDIREQQRQLTELQQAHESLSRERFHLEERFHRLNGEIESLRGDHERVLGEQRRSSAEIERLYREEKALRETVEDQTSHIGRLYGEIERLNGEIAKHVSLIRQMEQTRAWRFHDWFQRTFR